MAEWEDAPAAGGWEDAPTAKPVEEKPTEVPKEAPKEEEKPSFLSKLEQAIELTPKVLSILGKTVASTPAAPGVAEALAGGTVGMGEAAASGIAGLGAAAAGQGFSKGFEATKEALSPVTKVVEPTTKVGKATSEALGKLPEAIHGAGEAVYRKTDSPLLGAATEAFGTGLTFLIGGSAAKGGKAPIRETAFRNKETGEIELSGPKHDETIKATKADTHEPGFVDEHGNFLSRKEAAIRAKETGQIPKDHKLQFPEEGLHSGDLHSVLAKDIDGLKVDDKEVSGFEKFKAIFDGHLDTVQPEKVLKSDVPQPINVSSPSNLAFELHKTVMQHQADFSATSEFMKTAEKAGITEADTKAFLDYSEARAAGETPEVTKEFADKYDKWDGALQKQIVEVQRRMNPEDAAAIREDFSNRIALKKSMLSEVLKEERQGHISGQMKGGFARKPTSEKSRTVFALEDGTIITTKRTDEGLQVTKWNKGEPTVLGIHRETPTKTIEVMDASGNLVKREVPDVTYRATKPSIVSMLSARPAVTIKATQGEKLTKLKEGDVFQGQKVKQAQKKDIEEHTHIRYLENGLAVKSMLLNSLKKAEREREVVRQLKESDYSKNYMFPADEAHLAPEGFRELSPEAKTALPSLRDNVFAPEYAEVLEDFAGKYRDSGALDAASNIVIRAMMINPYPHFMNELVHWFDARGASGYLSPTQITEASLGFPGLKYVGDAFKSVIRQDEFQRELMRSGGFLLAPSTKAQIANKRSLEIGLKDLMKDAVARKSVKDIASAIGTTPGRLLMKVSDLSSNIMWSTRDMMYTHLIKEQMAMGKNMEQAIKDVGKHMPEYFIPHRVAGSRKLSQAMQSKLLVFSRYHYGWMRAYGENAKELAQIGRDNKEFAKGLDHALAMALGGLVVYKGLDAMYSQMFGEETEARRAGAYHAPDVAVKVAKGEKDYSSLLSAFFTINPAITGVAQVATNRDWQGKQIIPAGSSPLEALGLGARYVGSQMMPVQSVERSVEGQESPKQFLARMTDTQIQDAKKQRKIRELQAKASKQREAMIKKLKRKYGIE